MPPLFLLTDFGTADPYVAQMKGSILMHAPHANIIDLSHAIRPFDTAQAGFFLWASLSYFPRESVVLCVVDPGVGTDRRIVLVECEGRKVLAPDNGVTALLLARCEAGEGIRVFEMEKPRNDVSSTFHGRDIFAPLGAQLMQGALPETLGRPVGSASLVHPSWTAPRFEGNHLWFRVVHIDRFGNCLLNLFIADWEERLQGGTEMVLTSGNRPLLPVGTYSELGRDDVGILAGSQGVFEISMREKSAASELGIGPGDELECEVFLK